jgi:drug/metabolite transporter (DMT)-like permease
VQVDPAPPSRLVLGGVLLAGVSAISASAIFIRMADAPGVSTALWRSIFAAVMMGLIVLIGRVVRPRRWPDLTWRDAMVCVLGGIFLGLHFWSWMTSLEYTTVASSVLFVTMNPIFVGLLAPFVTKDRVTWRLWAGILLAVAGSLVVGYDDLATGPSTSLLGNGLALLGAAAGSCYLLAGRIARRRVPLDLYATATNTTSAALLLPAVLLTGAPLTGFTDATWGWFFLIALIPQLIGHNSLVWALKHVSAPVVALVILAEPLGSGALAWAVFDERPTGTKLLGASILLAGIFLASLKQSGNPSPS